MKKFSLKKITAAVSAAAMIATMGTSAFAAVGNPGSGVTIDTITKTLVDETNQIYNIKVDFTSSSANEIGMTMLTYGNADDSSLNLQSDWDNNKYKDDNSMKIVGVDQKEPVANGSTGSFEFKITTKQSAGAIYLKKGATALIALSGDGVTTPAVAPLSINAIAGYAAPVNLGEVSMAANADVQAELTAAAKGQSAAVYEKQDDEVSLGNVPLADATIGTWTEKDGTYTATATIPASTVMSGVDFPAAGLSVSLTATTKFTAVNAAKATAVEGFTANEGATEFTKTVTADDSTSDATLKNQLVGKKVTLADESGKVSGAVTITDSMVATDETYDSATESDQVITYTVTVPEGATDNTLLNVSSGGIAVTAKITVTKTPVIKAIALEGAEIEVSVTKGDTDEATSAAIKSALDAKIASGYKFVVDGTDVTISNATYAWTVTGSGNTFTATMKVTAVTGEGLAEMPATGIDATLPKITITVNDKPAYVYGDLNGDGKVNMVDAGLAKQRFLKKIDQFTDSTGSTIDDAAGDLNGDGKVNMVDAGLIKQKFLKKIDQFPVEG